MGRVGRLLGREVLKAHRKLLLAGVIIGLVIGIAAGKAWAVLENPGSPVQTLHIMRPEPSSSSTSTSTTLAPETTTTTTDPAWTNLVALAVRIGRCEEPGNGEYGIDWTADGWTSAGHFAGGLGMNVDLYASLSGGHYAPNDPPEEQIRVFGLAWVQFGQRAWGCPA